MLTLSDTALNDNQVIWLVKIDADTTIKLASKDITLSSNAWDGQVVLNDSLSDGGKAIDISYGGGIGSVGSFELSIARYNFNALTDGFHTEFYPDSGGVYLTSRVVHIGFLWEGATTEAEITWFFYGYIDEYSYDADKITLTCLEYAEFENIELPYYKIQKETDNGMSYYPAAPRNNMGLAIPLLYGFFRTTEGSYDNWMLANAVCVHEGNLVFKVASHKCLDNLEVLYKYLSGAKTYLVLTPEDGDNSTTIAGYWVALYNTSRTKDKRILGSINLRCTILGGISEIGGFDNIVDQDDTNYFTLSNATATNLLALKIDAQLSGGDLGQLSYGAGDISFIVEYACDAAANRDIDIYYYHLGVNPRANSAGAGYNTATYASTTPTNIQTSMGQYVDVKIETTLPWTIEELIGLEWCIENTTAIVGDESIRIYAAYLSLANITVSGILPRKLTRTKMHSPIIGDVYGWS